LKRICASSWTIAKNHASRCPGPWRIKVKSITSWDNVHGYLSQWKVKCRLVVGL